VRHQLSLSLISPHSTCS